VAHGYELVAKARNTFTEAEENDWRMVEGNELVAKNARTTSAGESRTAAAAQSQANPYSSSRNTAAKGGGTPAETESRTAAAAQT
jgi:hypothetical protein